jgi:hypothetical protein
MALLRPTDGSSLSRCMDIELLGLPTHVWELETAEQLLNDHGLVMGLHPDTEDRWDLVSFKLSAWCDRPENIPSIMDLHVVEPLSLRRESHRRFAPSTTPVRSRVKNRFE